MRRTLTLLGAVTALAMLASPTARADRKNPLSGQPAVRHRVELRKNRFEITPQFMVSMNQDFKHFIGGGVVLQYHIADWIGIAVQVAGGGALDSGLASKINETLVSESDTSGRTPTQFQPTKEQFQSHLAKINMLFSAYAAITPIAGKMMIFGSLPLRYDTYLMVGVGGMNQTNSFDQANANSVSLRDCEDLTTTTDSNGNHLDTNKCDPHNSGIAFGGMFGVGVHLFFNDWAGINLEVRDFLASTNPGGLDVNGDQHVTNADKTISNSLFFGLGVTFLLPIHAKVSN